MRPSYTRRGHRPGYESGVKGTMSMIRSVSIVLIAASLGLSACTTTKGAKGDASGQQGGFLTLEEGGLNLSNLFNGGKSTGGSATGENSGIGVNSFLWRASLDTLAFMPLTSADPWGGLILTDWYANPEKPDERFKATVYILDTRLRADALKVTVYKQVKDGNGGWVDAAPSSQTEVDLENAILTRARQLRLSVAKR